MKLIKGSYVKEWKPHLQIYHNVLFDEAHSLETAPHILAAAKSQMYSRLLFYSDSDIETKVVYGQKEEDEKEAAPCIFEADSGVTGFLLEMKVFEPLAEFVSYLGQEWKFGDMKVRVCAANLKRSLDTGEDQSQEYGWGEGEGFMLIQVELSHTTTSSESDLKETFLNEHFKLLGNFFIKDSLRKQKQLNDRDEMLSFYKTLGLSCRLHSTKHKAAQFIFYYKKFTELVKKPIHESLKKT